MNKLILTITLFIVSLNLKAQTFEWDLGFFGFADNREYSSSGRPSPTLIGLQLSPEVGLLMDSTHRVRVGINLLHELGSKNNASKVNPTLYYNYKKEHINFFMGLFPRAGLVDGFSNALLSDTLQYYRPNLSGILFRYEKQKIFQQIWLDWNSKQSETQREQFLVGLSGNVKLGSVFLAHEAVLWHNALPKNADESMHLQDNATMSARLGWDLSSRTKVDSLTLSAGALMSLNRDRGVDVWESPVGMFVEGYVAYKAFFIHNILYMGEPQKSALGDSFYSEKTYNRLDLGWIPLRSKRLSAKLAVSFHFTPGAISNQQTFSLRYNIGAQHKLRASWF